jgi:NodT family efflux transporter outer membrane factor (OMF) lipoprotein
MNSKQTKYLFWAGVILLTAFSSCQVINKYKSPDTDLSGLYRGEQPEDTTTIASIPWKHYFADTCLHALIEGGLLQNHDLRIAYTRIRQAEANLTIARSAYFPVAILAGQATHAMSSAKDGKTDVLGYSSNQFGLGIAVQWEADIWGKINRQGHASYARLLGSYTYKNLIQTSLVATIANSYYSLLALDEQLRITQETILLLKESALTMQALMDAGMLNGAAVQQSKALLYNTQISIPGLESRIRELENTLCVLTGRKPGPVKRLNIRMQNVPAEMKHGIPAQLLAGRPDVIQAEMSFRAAFEMRNAAQAALYPSITLSSGSMIGYGAPALSDFFRPENILANIVGGLTQPLFAGNQLRGQVKITKAQQEEALLNFEKTVLTAGQEVSDILYTFESSLRKNELRTQQIETLTTAVYYTQQLLKAGEANYTEVLTAEQNLLQAQLSQISDKLEQIQAVVNLYRALGGGVF